MITLLLTFLGACAGGGKLLLNQIQKSLDARFASQDQARLANHEQLSYRLDAIERPRGKKPTSGSALSES
ncbi:hypothetical protein HUS13_30680 [Pseudomonas aeruginosa]|uniref:hypothetical protein n=1 Tax=Pseudomonas aeruginosa TaxID=287 RepID=UPI0019250187|nr:hypothetical protein [Pseudomonas aeruginosa]QQW18764.1 hypothetical protein HUS13_30680 [Pseudomonas aeruginosa]